MVRNNLSLFDNFNQLTPFAVGFERHFNRLSDYVEHNATSTGFPPYNIQKVEDFKYEIEIALAGFSKDDLEIEKADGVLSIRSTKETSDKHDDEIFMMMMMMMMIIIIVIIMQSIARDALRSECAQFSWLNSNPNASLFQLPLQFNCSYNYTLTGCNSEQDNV